MTTKTANLQQRVYQAIHHHFRLYGCSPSYIDIGLAVGIHPRHVGRPLRGLMERGLLIFTPGAARSIVLADRLENCSDAEIERAARQRGGRIVWSDLPVLAETFTAAVATCGIETEHELALMLDHLAGDDDGAAGQSTNDEAEQELEGDEGAARDAAEEGGR